MAHEMTFWFDFSSSYSYLSAIRIEDAAKAAGVTVTWQPFLLGPIFAAQGMTSSPFSMYPAKGQAMWRDIERIAEDRGLRFKRIEDASGFPQNSLNAARLAVVALDRPEGPAFCREVYRAQFERGADIAEPDTLADALTRAGLPLSLADEARADENRPRLRDATERAMKAGVFGAPSFTFNGELFWGDDRLDQALAWAARG